MQKCILGLESEAEGQGTQPYFGQEAILNHHCILVGSLTLSIQKVLNTFFDELMSTCMYVWV